MDIPSIDNTARSAALLRGPTGIDSGSSTPAQPQVSLTLVGCFDFAGDGQINSRSALDGGDATLLVPSHEVDLPTWPHAALLQGFDSTHEQSDHTTAGRVAPPMTGATRHAVDAYQRYGQPLPIDDVHSKAATSDAGARVASHGDQTADLIQHASP
jgi:hypothetical protein